MAGEFLDVVDDEDNVVGRRPRSECLERGILHRAIAILLFDERGRLYIQKRSDTKSWYPGYWTLSVMGHVSSGETYEQAAKRELSEELGINCQLRRVTKLRMPDYPYNNLVECEYLAIFEGKTANPKIALSEETTEGKFVGLVELVQTMGKRPEKYTPDSVHALNAYLETAKKKDGRS